MGCAGDDGDTSGTVPDCLDLQLDGCALAFQPTFDNVFGQVLGPTCGAPGSSCHGEPNMLGAANGLLFQEQAEAHDLLIMGGYVTPGDASCSEMMIRMSADDELIRMPPGSTKLDENVRCSIAQWIDEGAQP